MHYHHVPKQLYISGGDLIVRIKKPVRHPAMSVGRNHAIFFPENLTDGFLIVSEKSLQILKDIEFNPYSEHFQIETMDDQKFDESLIHSFLNKNGIFKRDPFIALSANGKGLRQKAVLSSDENCGLISSTQIPPNTIIGQFIGFYSVKSEFGAIHNGSGHQRPYNMEFSANPRHEAAFNSNNLVLHCHHKQRESARLLFHLRQNPDENEMNARIVKCFVNGWPMVFVETSKTIFPGNALYGHYGSDYFEQTEDDDDDHDDNIPVTWYYKKGNEPEQGPYFQEAMESFWDSLEFDANTMIRSSKGEALRPLIDVFRGGNTAFLDYIPSDWMGSDDGNSSECVRLKKDLQLYQV